MRHLIDSTGAIDRQAVADLAKENYRHAHKEAPFSALLSAAYRLARAQKEAALIAKKEAAARFEPGFSR